VLAVSAASWRFADGETRRLRGLKDFRPLDGRCFPPSAGAAVVAANATAARFDRLAFFFFPGERPSVGTFVSSCTPKARAAWAQKSASWRHTSHSHVPGIPATGRQIVVSLDEHETQQRRPLELRREVAICVRGTN